MCAWQILLYVFQTLDAAVFVVLIGSTFLFSQFKSIRLLGQSENNGKPSRLEIKVANN